MKPRPLTKKELKARANGSAVFVVCLDKTAFAADPIQGWGLLRTSLVRLWYHMDLMVFDYHFEDYGKLWVAYDSCVDESLLGDWRK
jgi:hypothetical protein